MHVHAAIELSRESNTLKVPGSIPGGITFCHASSRLDLQKLIIHRVPFKS